jgi:hypothetical protein
MVLNAKTDTAASLMAAKHPVRPSNAVDSEVVDAQATDIYTWEGRVLDSHATPIPKVGNVFKPISDDQVACLEHLVTAGIVIKTVESGE